MRRPMSALALAVALAAGMAFLSGSAAALSITPDPIHQERLSGAPGGALDADVDVLSISGSTIEFQLTVHTGSLLRLDFSFLGSPDLGGPTFNFTTGGSVSGAGIGGTATDVFGTEVQVVFDESVDAGESTGVITIGFASAVGDGYQGAITFDNGYALDETYDIVAVPEAGTLLLLGAALASLRSRRRTRA